MSGIGTGPKVLLKGSESLMDVPQKARPPLTPIEIMALVALVLGLVLFIDRA